MTEKLPQTGDVWENNLARAVAIFEDHDSFLFGGDIDPDSVGSMMSLSLYLVKIGKRAGILISENLGDNLDYFEKIIAYNGIEVLRNVEDIKKSGSSYEALVFCDTANTKLVPFFAELSEHVLPQNPIIVEIDHHFGADSEQIREDSAHLFREANANTEIIGELLNKLKSRNPSFPAPFEQRNILLGLITGLLGDTVGGRVVHYRKDFDSWLEILGGALEKNTRLRSATPDRPGDTKWSKFSSPKEILQYLDKLTDEQQKCLDRMESRISIQDGLGVLNILNSTYGEVADCCREYNSDWFSELLATLVNLVPEKSGKVGAVVFNGKNAEGADCIFMKFRRAVDYDGFDLRTAEDLIRSTFNSHYMGGGGHAGAVSFRVSPHDESQFLASFQKITDFVHSNLK
ncbi:MAG: hypothetical protein G3M78_05980 [Candidatus Nitrohelix vancouverensis]|uniref:DHH family phosphoesterase n=1 Tax=Candidatus Nitrohelix vancouverensis TaxID=2705534 RepID=A0A7T0C226_9BACT|nr:MAG: hypothetical protein G3M78_05980 [Candidatus Nitrohelix vancouverensis]